MKKFQIYAINVIYEQILDDETFNLNVHCEVEEKGIDGGEAFVVKIISPRYLENIIDSNNPVELGRGYIITNTYDLDFLKSKLQNLLDRFNSNSWNELSISVEKYFDWIE